MANNVTVTEGVSRKVAKEILLTAGASDTNLKKNIYDLAGNVREWTLETDGNYNHTCNNCFEKGSLC